MSSLGNVPVTKTDVLVVGSGGSALRAAIEAKVHGASVIVLTKGLAGRSGCSQMTAHSSIIGSRSSQGDGAEVYINDVMKGGGFLGNQRLVEIVVSEGPDRVRELEKWGAQWDRKPDGSLNVYHMAGHSFPRTFTSKGNIGKMVQGALLQEAFRKGLVIQENTAATRLLFGGNRVVGACALNFFDGKLEVFSSKSTILATGSYGQIYKPSTAVREDTGDGHVMALHVGASLVDMEHTIFLPTEELNVGQKWENGVTPKLLNALGERFMQKYNPSGLEFATKEVIVRAVLQEIREGRGTKNGGVYVDLRHLPWDQEVVRDYYSDIVESEGLYGRNPRNDLVEMKTRAHAPVGGVMTDEHGRTNVDGLYAAGAVVGGLYGNARISGFVSISCLVFGRRAGQSAAEEALSTASPGCPAEEVKVEEERLTRLLTTNDGEQVARARNWLQTTMMEKAGPVKDQKDLLDALNLIREHRKLGFHTTSKNREHNLEWLEAIELENLFEIAEMVVIGSLARKESRTSFLRKDYPNRDDENWLRNTTYELRNGKVALGYRVPNNSRGKSVGIHA